MVLILSRHLSFAVLLAGDSGPKKRPVYGKKKAAQKKQELEAEDEARAAADKAAAEAAEEAERQRKLREKEAEVCPLHHAKNSCAGSKQKVRVQKR